LISINAAAAECFKALCMSTTLTLAERAVPRYTSYPTAPHFSSDVGPETYAAWLAALPADATLSLYLHVPYCGELCLYCGWAIDALSASGIVARDGHRILVTVNGRPFVRLVAAAFDAYLPQNNKRHSVAV
jgi:coproporphyrinogen III oxidase-like Fe-S oxidoreductase